nr:MAG TPA: hypothetical protein [Caudoviricetes sp.]
MKCGRCTTDGRDGAGLITGDIACTCLLIGYCAYLTSKTMKC